MAGRREGPLARDPLPARAVWITQGRDARDHIIKAGEMFLITQRRKVIVQALANARLKVTPCLATTTSRSACFTDGILP